MKHTPLYSIILILISFGLWSLPVVAANLTTSGNSATNDPYLFMNDTDVDSDEGFFQNAEWYFANDYNFRVGNMGLNDFILAARNKPGNPDYFHIAVVEIYSEIYNDNSLVIDTQGDIAFANNALYIDRSAQKVSLGGGGPKLADLSLWDGVPNLRLHDEDDTSEVSFVLNGKVMYLTGRALDTDPMKQIISYDTNAPEDSLKIAANGGVSTAGGLSLTDGLLSLSSASASSKLWFINQGNNAYVRLNGSKMETLVPFTLQGIPYSYDTNAPDTTLLVAATGNLGLGTTDTSEALNIHRVDTGARMKLDNISSSSAPQMIWRRARSNVSQPDSVQFADTIGRFNFIGYDGNNFSAERGHISVQATENWTPTSNGSQLTFGITLNTTLQTSTPLIISENGDIILQGTALNVPDYVFTDGYNLRDMDELAAYLGNNRHLPGLNPAKTINTHGLDVGDTQLAVLEKVEELTLYILKQHRQLKDLKILATANRKYQAAALTQEKMITAQATRIQALNAQLSSFQQQVNLLIDKHAQILLTGTN